MLGFPVDFERPHGSKLGSDGVEDFKTEVVARVSPGGHEDDEVWAYYGMVDVVENFRGLKGPS